MKPDDRCHDSEDEQTARKKPLITRRSLCYGAGGLAFLAVCGSLKLVDIRPAVRPPGGQNGWDVVASCVHCSRCAEACPHQVIALSHIEDGIVGMRTPRMTFANNWCSFCVEENNGVPLCAAACPTGALNVEDAAGGPKVAIGKAHLVTEWCLAYRETGCHTCYDYCPYEAIELDEFNRPVVIEDRCNGCGACEATCVSLTNGSLSLSSGVKTKAITIVPLESK